jgi:RNA polymerase sigma-70 factor (ECF subfamily)
VAELFSAEQYRDYLHLLARMQLAPALAGKVDLSGIVQQTLWEAARDGSAEKTESEVLPWLRQILANNLRDEFRRWHAMRRDVKREQPLEAVLAQSSARLEMWAASPSSPSQKAARNEELARLATALAALPEDQRTAVELHHLQGLPLSQLAERLGRSSEAAASLLYRAMQRLKKHLSSED